MWRKGDFSRLIRQDFTQVRLLLAAAIALWAMSAAVHILPFRHIAKFLSLAEGQRSMASTPSSLEVVTSIRWALRTVSARLPWTCTCLSQALAGAILLNRRKLPALLHLGIAKGAERSAHAWLYSGNAEVAGTEVAQDFVPVAVFSNGY